MKNNGWLSRLFTQPSFRMYCAAGAAVAALLLAAAGTANAQDAAAAAAAAAPAPEAQMSIPAGYTAHYSADVGGRMTGLSGSGAMYDTLVNLQSGPRVMGESFQLHALPTNKHTLVDDLSAFSNGFGGGPYNFATLNASKGNVYEFSGTFRRDRRYFDYDLLGNPGIPSGYSIPVSGSTTPYAWPQDTQSPFMFNTVRRMTDANITLFPLSKVTFRFDYSQNIFQGPSQTPSGNAVAGSEVLLQEYQRNSSDDFMGAVDWKPINGTKLTYEEQIDHYKGDSYFTMAPGYLAVQEPDGTKVSLLDSYQSFLPYGYSSAGAFAPTSNCNTSSMVNSSIILRANPNGGLPIVDPACNVISSYYRSQPTREIFPTEIFRLQSTSVKNLEMNGDVRYTSANMNMPNYYEDYKGLDKASRELASSGLANAKREVIAVDYGIVWQATKTVSLEDQVTYSDAHQPAMANLTGGTTVTVPTTAGQETINSTSLTAVQSTTGAGPGMPSEGGPSIGAPVPNYFGQSWMTNNATVSWDAGARTTLSLTYRYSNHVIVQGLPHNLPVANCVPAVPAGYTSAVVGTCGTVTINGNGGILNVATRPSSNWDLNGSVEMLYNDNVFTPVAPRQSQHYRIHTLYRPKTWATVSAAYNDLEQHNNTNNTGATGTGLTAAYDGPLDHVFHSRIFTVATDLMPNEHYGLDLNYAFNDVYTATNICFQGAALAMPGGTVAPAAANQSGQLCSPVLASTHGSPTTLFYGRDFDSAPTQYVSAAVMMSPNPKLHSNVGYRISDVNGSRFFTDAGDVNGSTVSAYQTPFLNVAWTVHPGLIWKAEYDYYGYGEGGRSGAQYCNNNPALAAGVTSAPVVPCSSVANTAMSSTTPVYGFTAPRNFHANNVVLGMHYEF